MNAGWEHGSSLRRVHILNHCTIFLAPRAPVVQRIMLIIDKKEIETWWLVDQVTRRK